MVIDSNTGLRLYSNEVLAAFVEGTSSARIAQIAAAINGTVVGTEPALGMYQIAFIGTGTPQAVDKAVAALRSFPEVALATPNYIGSVDEVAPNDPGFSAQYAPRRIRADEAWIIARGGPVIAILDTGVDYTHPDLAAKVVKGKDYVNGGYDPLDDNGHGTHVAGIAAASSNNGVGVTGIAWNSRILAVKICDRFGNWGYGNAAAALSYAADEGARIINCSWSGPSDVAFAPFNAWLGRAVNHAVSRGAMVVAAAGNQDSSVPRYPAAFANVISVGSTTSFDDRAYKSNFGPTVDIAAPGAAIWSTLPTYHVTSNDKGSPQEYGYLSGTSMAAPCVSGSLAVLWSRFPAWSAAQVRERMERTAKRLPFSLGLGNGRIDLFEAVFNGSFEDGVNGWDVVGTGDSITSLGPIKPTSRNPNVSVTDGERMGIASSGPDNAQVQTTLEQPFRVQPGVTSIPVTFDYNFVSEEWEEWIGKGYNDNMRIQVITPSGKRIELAYEDIDHSPHSMFTGVDFPGGDDTIGQTGWKQRILTIPTSEGPGIYKFSIVVRDEGDGIYDSAVLIDNIRFKDPFLSF